MLASAMDARRLATDRLVLISATAQHLLVELEDPLKLGRLIGAEVPEAWPPADSGEADLRQVLGELHAGNEQVGWWRRYVVQRKGPHGRPALVGHAGLNGRPGDDGAVRIGATFLDADPQVTAEAIGGLVDWAMSHDEVLRVQLPADHSPDVEAAADRYAFDDADAGIRVLQRDVWADEGPCLPRRIVPKPSETPIEGIPPVARATFDALMKEPLREPDALLREVALYVEMIESAAVDNPYVDNDLGRSIARVCDGLLHGMSSTLPEHTRRQIQAAVRYFVTEDDGDSDLAIGGLDEDAAVANAVAAHLGRGDLVADLQ
jgi:hypothetical protein